MGKCVWNIKNIIDKRKKKAYDSCIMNTMKASLLSLAIKKSQQSYCKFRVSAIGLDKRGNVIATAVNRPRLDKLGGGTHAEIIVLQKGGPRVRSILICRTGNSGEIRPIACCASCKKVLDKKGIKVYTVDSYGELQNGQHDSKGQDTTYHRHAERL